MVVLIIVQLMTIAMFFLFGYLILKKDMYDLISGFATKTEEEQQELIDKGYPQANAKGLIYSGWILVIGLLLQFIGVPHAILISLGVMTVFLFAYMLYINKLDVARVRKRNFIILLGTIIFTFGIIGFVVWIGTQPNHLTISETDLHVSGNYGVDWPLDEITNVELMEDLPKIQMRTNGFAAGERLKGRFRLEDLGNGRLFIYRNNPPFIFIEKGEDYLIINSRDIEQTEQWYKEVQDALQ